MKKLSAIINSGSEKFDKLLKEQKSRKLKEGCYVYELEADVTIPAEFILLMHYLGDIDLEKQKKIKNYILSKQNNQGGWPLFHEGDSNLSASVKAYYALKLCRINEKSKAMIKAREYILKNGGVEKVNVFTKITLALFGQVSWDCIPFMPIEIIRFPSWFPFTIYKISYWSRTVLIPLLIIMHRKPVASNPNKISIDELFLNLKNKKQKIKLISRNDLLSKIFIFLDKFSRIIFPIFSNKFKENSEKKAIKWLVQRLNGEDGLGGIFPAMVNSVIALKIIDEKKYKMQIKTARRAIEKLIVEKKNSAYCQPCVSPVWDSGWMGIVNLENGKNVDELVKWFLKKEIKV